MSCGLLDKRTVTAAILSLLVVAVWILRGKNSCF